MPAVYRYLLVFDPVYLPGEPMKSLIITRKLALPMCFRFPMGLLNPWSMLMLIKLSLAVVGGLVFFIDGKKACTPMRAPLALLALMDQVATAKINHEGTGL